MVAFLLAFALLAVRAGQLQVLENERLVHEGEERHLRTVTLSAHRGSIRDRHGEYLALSTPVDSIWVDAKVLLEHEHDDANGAAGAGLVAHDAELETLARTLGLEHDRLVQRVTMRSSMRFVYLRRHLAPSRAASVLRLGIPGVHSRREYRRYYPANEVTSHVLGFTDIDDRGIEGLELAFDHWLAGEPGSKRVLRDRHGRSVEDVDDLESVSPARPGRELQISVDLRLQYFAYRALKSAVLRHRAAAGSVVILDVETGEVLAMVNQPGYNPNDRSSRRARQGLRNRAVTDIFEPGSSFKPMVMAAALESGEWAPDSPVDTSPIRIGKNEIRDPRPLGVIDATTVLTRSSNVGIARIARSLPPKLIWRTLTDLGFGQLTASGFPGESAGLLRDYRHWQEIGQATLSYGYGVSVTPLQLAQAYATIANGGRQAPVTFVRRDEPPKTRRVLSEASARTLMWMLEQVVEPDGTGRRAAVSGYRVAGKTGTARKSGAGGYDSEHHVSVFAGMAPASAPRLAVVVVVDDPAAGAYYGSEVAAPVFAEIMSDALRLLAVPPDDAGVPALAAGTGAGAAEAGSAPDARRAPAGPGGAP
jgi:cell division protein FtsI (penicillin-binding protein 3)